MTMNVDYCKDVLKRYKEEGICIELKQGSLVPITYDFEDSMPECAALLSKWRIENPSLSPAEFVVTEKRTTAWIEKAILNNPNRILFMIKDDNQRYVGHIGISNIDPTKGKARLDSVMRGETTTCKTIMRDSIETLVHWCSTNFGVTRIDLVVLSDNERAIRLYRNCGFVSDGILPLKKIQENGEINWIEDATIKKPEKSYLHMEYIL
ncbi:Protein N-acetyltransferase, RimJ/RimL family [Oscillospiraceae bacterium]|nr:Protein N-acetyltransferase, RimJ/RimL family [Oscillospiraceae bacterium]